jgi:hypothetical protein
MRHSGGWPPPIVAQAIPTDGEKTVKHRRVSAATPVLTWISQMG